MFARNVTFQVKHGKDQEFLRLMNTEVLPLLKKQEGFKNELTLLTSDRGLGISLWDTRVNADKYARQVFPEIVKKLTPYLEGTPKVEMCEVGATTLH